VSLPVVAAGLPVAEFPVVAEKVDVPVVAVALKLIGRKSDT